MDLQNIIPKDGPAIEEVQKYIKKYIDEVIVIKCGGSVLLDQNLFNQFIEDISVIIPILDNSPFNVTEVLNEISDETKSTISIPLSIWCYTPSG